MCKYFYEKSVVGCTEYLTLCKYRAFFVFYFAEKQRYTAGSCVQDAKTGKAWVRKTTVRETGTVCDDCRNG